MKILLMISMLVFAFSANSFSKAITVKVKDICQTAANKTCVIGKNGNMTIKVADMKSKKTSTNSSLYPTDLNEANYQVIENFFIPDPDNCSIGVGVIDGLMYFPLNPLETYYYWIYDTSLQFSDYNSWKIAFENIYGPGSAPENCSISN